MSSFQDSLKVRHDFQLANIDTDSISFSKSDMAPFNPEERADLLQELNDQFPELIKFSDDGYFETFIVVASKNYILWDGKKLKIKGASLKASNKEFYLKDLIKGIIDILLDSNYTQQQCIDLYNTIALECIAVKDMSRFSFKKTFTKAVQEGEGTAELKARLALKYEQGVQQGDKFRMFYLSNSNLCLEKNFSGDYCRKTLLKKLYATVKIFHNILPTELFINYSLQTNYYPFIGEEKPKKAKKI